MPRLGSYLLRETAGLYLLGVAAFCLLLSIDFLTVWAQYLIQQNASLATVARLMLYKLPFFLHMALPVAVVFAVLLATGRLAKDSELKAAYSLGVPPLRLLTPLLLFGLGVGVIAIINNGFIEPRAEIASDHLVASFYYDRPPAEAQSDVSYAIPNEGIYYAGRIEADPDNRHIARLSGILVRRDDGSLISALEGVWDSNERVWMLTNAQIAERGQTPQQAWEVMLPFIPVEAGSSLARSQTLALDELYARMQALGAAGGDTRGLVFEFHRRIADAFSALIFILLAGGLGLHLRGRSSGFAWTIVLLVFFYFMWTLSGDLFEQRVLSPVFAAYFTSLVVGAVGAAIALVRLR